MTMAYIIISMQFSLCLAGGANEYPSKARKRTAFLLTLVAIWLLLH